MNVIWFWWYFTWQLVCWALSMWHQQTPEDGSPVIRLVLGEQSRKLQELRLRTAADWTKLRDLISQTRNLESGKVRHIHRIRCWERCPPAGRGVRVCCVLSQRQSAVTSDRRGDASAAFLVFLFHLSLHEIALFLHGGWLIAAKGGGPHTSFNMWFLWKHVQRSESSAAARRIYITRLWRDWSIWVYFLSLFKTLLLS